MLKLGGFYSLAEGLSYYLKKQQSISKLETKKKGRGTAQPG